MQNIADALVDSFPKKLEAEAQQSRLQAFITYNTRRKTLSVTKSSYQPGASPIGTPEGCLYEMMANARDLLHDHCGMELPEMQSEEAFLQQGPSLLLLYHPALGPLYSIIAQKMRGGKWERNSELQLEIAELDLLNLNLAGSLTIKAEAVLGKEELSCAIVYGEECGKCTLRHVTVANRGINRSAPNVYWKNQIQRHEQLSITLEGNGEFFAENVTFRGTHKILVPDGHRMEAYQENGKIQFRLKKISKPTWGWKYAFDAEDHIVLNSATIASNSAGPL